MAWWQQPFFQVALPVIVAFAIATWFQSNAIDGVNKRIDDLSAGLNKRIDDLRDSINRRLDSIDARLGRIETVLVQHEQRLTTLEERISPLRR